MGKLGFIKTLLTSPFDRTYFLASHGMYHSMSDEAYIRKLWKYKMDYDLNLDDPKTFCEKMQYLKIYDHDPRYTRFADKYAVKQIVSDAIGSEHVIPLLGVWDSFDDIDFDKLPDRFILKTTHDSGGFVVCKDKSSFNKEYAKKKLSKALKRNYYWGGREWQYKDIPPKIIAEEYIESLGKRDSIEYKITCMNGEYKFVTVCRGIAHSAFSDRSNDSYDENNEHMPWYAYYENSKEEITLPEQMDQMREYAVKLAQGIPYVRVDFYLVDGHIYFGEMTFCTWNGFLEFTPPEWDLKLGEMLSVEGVKK